MWTPCLEMRVRNAVSQCLREYGSLGAVLVTDHLNEPMGDDEAR